MSNNKKEEVLDEKKEELLIAKGELLLDEFKYRHECFWNLVFKFIYSLMIVFASYFLLKHYQIKLALSSNIVKTIWSSAVLFISVISAIVLHGEYKRISIVNNSLKKVKKSLSINKVKCNKKNKYFSIYSFAFLIPLIIGVFCIAILIIAK